MKKKISNYTILLLLAVLFAAPGITAYFVYLHPDWLGASTVNKGQLIQPPPVLNAFEGTPKWRMVFWSPSVCDKACMAQLDTLARARLALGRQLYNVDLWLILADKASVLSPEQEMSLKEKDIQVARLSSVTNETQAILSSDFRIFIANPEQYLILGYKDQANPEDIYKDLRRLLSSAK